VMVRKIRFNKKRVRPRLCGARRQEEDGPSEEAGGGEARALQLSK
jgi:hypothetical protein